MFLKFLLETRDDDGPNCTLGGRKHHGFLCARPRDGSSVFARVVADPWGAQRVRLIRVFLGSGLMPGPSGRNSLLLPVVVRAFGLAVREESAVSHPKVSMSECADLCGAPPPPAAATFDLNQISLGAIVQELPR